MRNLRIVTVMAVIMMVMTAFGAVMMAEDSSAATSASVTVDPGQSISKTLSSSTTLTGGKAAIYGSSDNGVAPSVTYTVDFNLVATNTSKKITPEVTFSGTAPTTSGVYTKTVTATLGTTSNAKEYGSCEFNLTITVNQSTVTYTVSFVTNGGSACSTQYVESGKYIWLPQTTKSGHTFDGWYDSSGRWVGPIRGTYYPTQNITLYAHWVENVVTYTVSFNGNGGTSPSSQTVQSGTSISLPSTSQNGYSFDGWYTSVTGGSYVGSSGSTYTPTGNITLYAHWTKLSLSMSSISGSTDIVMGSSATYSFTGTSGCSVSITGASWLSSSSSGATYYLTGVPSATGDYSVTVTLSKSGYDSVSGTVSIHVVDQLKFLSVPTAAMIVNA